MIVIETHIETNADQMNRSIVEMMIKLSKGWNLQLTLLTLKQQKIPGWDYPKRFYVMTHRNGISKSKSFPQTRRKMGFHIGVQQY